MRCCGNLLAATFWEGEVVCGECGFERGRGRFCGRCGAHVADLAGDEPSRPGAVEGAAASTNVDVVSRRGRAVRRWAPAAALAVVVTGAVIGLSNQTDGGTPAEDAPPAEDSDGDTDADPPSADGFDGDGVDLGEGDAPEEGFADKTGTVLLFDDGHGGALAVDLDTWQRRPVELLGQQPGDQPFRLGRLGERVVVGWGEIWAALPDQSDTAEMLGEATVFLPHVGTESLWLVDYAGRRVGQGTSTWTLIDASGEELAEVPTVPAGLLPVRGVPGGLAVQSDDGLLIYDLEQQRLVANPTGSSARLADVTPQQAAWCEADPCSQLLLTDEDGELLTTIEDEVTFDPDQVWVEPGGDRVAAGVRVEVDDAVDLRLRVYGTEDGERVADTQIALGSLFGDWTTDGQFFAWNHMPGTAGGPAILHRWVGGDIEQVSVGEHGIRDVHDFIAMPSRLVENLFTSAQARSTD